MQVSPFQDLFIKQELANGLSLNNVLRGIAKIENVSVEQIKKAVNDVLLNSEWPFLHLSEGFKFWNRREVFSGNFQLEKKSHNISLSNLWSLLVYYSDDQKVCLDFAMHHCLADAHSFQLFWKDFISACKGSKASPQSMLTYAKTNYPTEIDLGKIKNIEPEGLGPISRISLSISPKTLILGEQMAAQKNVSLSTFIVSSLQKCLNHAEEFLGRKLQTGIALRNRTGKQEKNDFLMKVNFLPLEHSTDLKILERSIRRCFRNQSFPLINWLNQTKRSVAFNVLFSYQKEKYETENDSMNAQFEFLPTSIDENLLALHVLDFGQGGLKLSFDVRTDIADVSFWRQFIVNFLYNTSRLLQDKKGDIKFTEGELKNTNFNNQDLWHYFEKAPNNKVAIITKNETVSFQELRKRISEEAIPNERVNWIKPNRTIDSIVSVMSSWKNNRIVTFNKEDLDNIPQGDYLYVAKTSGSTGEQKRIFIKKRGIESMLEDWKNRLSIKQESIHLSLANMEFDVFFGDLFRSLFLGCTLIFPDHEDRLSPHKISKLIKSHGVTHLESTPTFLKILIKSNDLTALEHLICGSEEMTGSLYEELRLCLPNTKIYNSYGLTEVSIDSALCEIQNGTAPYPVGYPLGDQSFKVVNLKREILPIGTWGELSISGNCVGIPAHQTKQYVRLESGSLEFFTGDKAMIHPKKGLVVSGRLIEDFLKVNGKRIPKVNIERRLTSLGRNNHHELIEKNGMAILVHDFQYSADELRSILSAQFSVTQLPDLIIQLKSWPINANGKIDRKKLKDNIFIEAHESMKWTPATNCKLEKKVYSVLQKFAKNYGSKEDSLFSYGWNSIDLLSLCNELTLAGIHTAPQKLIYNPTIQTILNEASTHEEEPNVTNEIQLEDSELDDILDMLNE